MEQSGAERSRAESEWNGRGVQCNRVREREVGVEYRGMGVHLTSLIGTPFCQDGALE